MCLDPLACELFLAALNINFYWAGSCELAVVMLGIPFFYCEIIFEMNNKGFVQQK